MSGILFELVVIFVLMLLNGLFAMAECAVISSRRARLQQMANEGVGGAQAALELSRAPTTFLSTVQIGITLIGIFAGAYGGQTFSSHLASWLSGIEFLAPYSEPLAFAVVVVAITYVSLVVGELVPKRLALTNPERISSLIAAPMKVLARIAGPAVRVLEFSTELLMRALRIKHGPEQSISEEEIKILIDQGTRSGVFEAAEKDIVYNVFRFTDRRVGSIMTPRADVVWLDVDHPLPQSLQLTADSWHSHFPVCRGSLENVLGMTSVKSLWAHRLAGKPELSFRRSFATPVRTTMHARAKAPGVVQAERKAHRVGGGRVRQPQGVGDADRRPGGHRGRPTPDGRTGRRDDRAQAGWLVAPGWAGADGSA